MCGQLQGRGDAPPARPAASDEDSSAAADDQQDAPSDDDSASSGASWEAGAHPEEEEGAPAEAEEVARHFDGGTTELPASDAPAPRDERFRRIYVRNTSTWGPGARGLVESPPFAADILGLLETHVPAGPGQVGMMNTWDAHGWRAAATPCRPSPRAEKSGGAIVGARRHLQVQGFGHLAAQQAQAAGLMLERRGGGGRAWAAGPIDFWDFQALAVRMRQGSLVVIVVYLEPNIGIRGPNLAKLALLGAFLGLQGGDWIVIGDWNATPEELRASSWLEEVGGQVVLPEGAVYTERQGRLIDYAVVGGPGVHRPRRIWPHFGGGFRSHCGLLVEYEAKPAPAMVRILPTPRRFAHPPRPPRRADPASKRSRRKAARAAAGHTAGLAGSAHDDELDGDESHQAQPASPIQGPPAWPGLQVPRAPALLDAAEGEWGPFQDLELDDGPPQDAADSQEGGRDTEQAEETHVLAAAGVRLPAAPPERTPEEREQLWQEAVAATQADDAWRSPPSYVLDSMAFQADAHGALQLGEVYGQWVTMLEGYFTRTLDIHVDERRKYMGRGCPRELKLVRVRAPTAAAPAADRAAAWWSSSAALADTLRAQARKAREAGATAKVAGTGAVAAQAAKSLRAQADSLPLDCAIPMSRDVHRRWRAALQAAPDWTAERCEAMAAGLSAVAMRVERHDAKLQIRGFHTWLCEQAATAPAGPIRWTNDPTLSTQQFQDSCDPATMLDLKRKEWQNRWTGAARLHDLQRLVADCRERARDEPLEALDVGQVLSLLSGLRTRTGRGTDNLGPADLRNAPHQAVTGLLHLFQSCEDAIAWPWQFLTMLEALLAKPAGGERAVALLPWPVRLWSHLRKPLGADWCDQKAGFWDEAVKGSSALLVALRRLFWDESAEL